MVEQTWLLSLRSATSLEEGKPKIQASLKTFYQILPAEDGLGKYIQPSSFLNLYSQSFYYL